MDQAMSVLTSHATDIWYTPPRYIELVREVLGSIDLDPASDALPQTWIKANRYYTKAQDGLLQSWACDTLWLNPPYGKTNGKSNQDLWSRLAVNRYEAGVFREGILLVNSTHGYKWFENLWTRYPVCCVTDRIRFIRADGTEGGQAKRGQTFVYLGKNRAKFFGAFSVVGRVLMPD